MPYKLEELGRVGQPIAMAVLLRTVEQHGTITYGEMAEHLGTALRMPVSWMHVGQVVGSMMNSVIELAPDAPPINALVVNKMTGLPGEGADWYIKRYLPRRSYDRLSDHQKRVVLLPVHDAIYAFEGWKEIAHAAFGDSLPSEDPNRADGESNGKTKRLGFGGPPESEEHRRLKEFVAANPKKFGAPTGCAKGLTEKRTESWDEIDVWFMTPDEQLAVEVKSQRSCDPDIQRGLFQCVKYRAVRSADGGFEDQDGHTCPAGFRAEIKPHALQMGSTNECRSSGYKTSF